VTTDDLTAAIVYVESHAPIRAWLLGRKCVVDIVSLSVMEMRRAIVISKEELIRRVIPRLERAYGKGWLCRWRVPLMCQGISMVWEWRDSDGG
jgi:hypothetical protein